MLSVFAAEWKPWQLSFTIMHTGWLVLRACLLASSAGTDCCLYGINHARLPGSVRCVCWSRSALPPLPDKE